MLPGSLVDHLLLPRRMARRTSSQRPSQRFQDGAPVTLPRSDGDGVGGAMIQVREIECLGAKRRRRGDNVAAVGVWVWAAAKRRAAG